MKREPTNEVRDVLKAASTKLRDVTIRAREKYWLDFTASIHRESSPRQVWNKIKRATGNRTRTAAHPNPKEHAESLIDKYAYASSADSLPMRMREAMSQKLEDRERIIHENVISEDECDKPITHCEIKNAIKRGNSTAPGSDGITYKILEALTKVEGQPLLFLFNMSYLSGTIPDPWKEATIIPIPKPSDPEAYRPISLTSCYLKMLERILLVRLLHKLQGKLDHSLHGFIKGKNTAHCITSFLCNKHAKYSAFIDLKGAFDKAQGIVILEELAKMGVKGKLLQWLKEYLFNRRANVFFQGHYSHTRALELGTPQGGVLSPMLFNVLMNKIATIELPNGVTHVGYADDILLQATSHRDMQRALNKLSEVCENAGFIISLTKTKAHKTGKLTERKFIINGQKISWVPFHKYLGVYVGGTQGRIKQFHELIENCNQRLRPLKAMAWNGSGASISILRMMYIAYIRSVIDYAAPALVCLGKNRLKKLESIQNEAMRIIIGCPRTVKILNLRNELNLPSLSDRIHEINTVSAYKLIKGNPDSLPAKELLSTLTNGPTSQKNWQNLTANRIMKYGLEDEFLHRDCGTSDVSSWVTDECYVRLPKRDGKKGEALPYMLKNEYLNIIEEEACGGLDKIFTDGSVDPISGNAGAAMTVVRHEKFVEAEEKGVRLRDGSSSTQTEIVGLLMALDSIRMSKRHSVIFCDSMSALFSVSTNVSVYPTLMNRVRKKLKSLSEQNISVKFVWIPSHVGIQGNERADQLAKAATQRDNVDYPLGKSATQIKSFIKNCHSEYEDALRVSEADSASIQYYNNVALNSNFRYGKNGGNRYRESVIARIRLGYLYNWQVGIPVEDANQKCKVCGEGLGHSLEHYILRCPRIDSFRQRDCNDLHTQAKHLLSNIENILQIHKSFASVR